MSDTIIRVEGLGKKYIISHEKKERYTAMRDIISTRARKIFNRSEAGQMSTEEFWALKDVDFEIKQGEAVGIIGRNGAGKSTLLKVLSRITEPSTGRIEMNGRIASLLEVGTGFHPELTGRENVFLNGAILGMSRLEIKKKFDEIVDFSGVEKFLDTPVKRYSSGMYVRLAFAVAAHLEPEILVVDEVLAVGDAEFQKKCLGKMEEVSKGGGRTVLFVSHNMGAISTLCNKCLLMSKGKLEAQGDTEKIVKLYINNTKSSEGKVVKQEIKYEQKCSGAVFEVICSKNKKGDITNSFGINEEISIELTYQVLNDDEIIVPYVHLLDPMGNCILASFNAPSTNLNSDPLYDVPLKKGVYKSTCIFPSFLLNEMQYHISCFLGSKTTSEFAAVRDILSFDIHDTGEMRKEYTGLWLGLIRPKLSWITEKV